MVQYAMGPNKTDYSIIFSSKNYLKLNRYPATGPHKKRALARILIKLREPQQHWHTGTLPGVVNPGPAFEPRTPIQGASCASWMV